MRPGRQRGTEQGFAALAGIVDELKEAQVDGQLLLGNAAVRASQGRFHNVTVDFKKY
jgi:hypothetical protein